MTTPLEITKEIFLKGSQEDSDDDDDDDDGCIITFIFIFFYLPAVPLLLRNANPQDTMT